MCYGYVITVTVKENLVYFSLKKKMKVKNTRKNEMIVS